MDKKESVPGSKKPKFSREYFKSEITRAEKARNDFYRQAEESISLFSGKEQKSLPDVVRRINVWWSVTNNVLPAYFSRLPQVETHLRKKTGNIVHNTTAIALERATQYVIDEEIPFSQHAFQAVLQYMLTGQGVLWLRYDSEVEERTLRQELVESEGGLYYLDGTQFDGEPISSDEGYYFESPYEEKVDEQAYIEAVHYKDFFQSVCRNQDEVEWKARKAYMSKEQVAKKFGSDTAKHIEYNTFPADLEKTYSTETNNYEGKAEVFEIWCRESGKVYYCTKGGDDTKEIFESAEPPIDFKDFWPCVEIYSNVTPDSVIPVGDWPMVKDQVIEVERLSTRIHSVTNAIRTNFAHDAALKELSDLFTGDLKAIPIKDWPQHKTRGGIGAMIEYAPTQPYVQALDTLLAAREKALDKLYESLKVTDLMRGITSPMETATAQQLKNNASNFQFGARQRQMEEFFSKTISKLAEVVAEHYDPMKLYQITNGEELGKQVAQAITKQSQQLLTEDDAWQMIVDTLRDDPARRYRVAVASDSMIALDERADRQERVDFMSSVGSFLGQLQPMIQQIPAIAPMAIETMSFVARSYKAGKELESTLDNMLETITAYAQQAQQQQMQQGEQDNKSIDAQAKIQVAQIEAQSDAAQQQLEMQKMQTDAMIKQAEIQLKQEQIALEREKMGLEAAKSQSSEMLEGLKMQLEQMKLHAQHQKEQMDTIQALYAAQGSMQQSSESKEPVTVNVRGASKKIARHIETPEGPAMMIEEIEE